MSPRGEIAFPMRAFSPRAAGLVNWRKPASRAIERRMNRSAVVYAFISAALFGASTPAAKLLIATTHPAVLAGLLYCGAGIGIALLRYVRASLAAAPGQGAALRRADLPWLAGA